jgi:CubicO group peptidase (beta-lactamase class C family)
MGEPVAGGVDATETAAGGRDAGSPVAGGAGEFEATVARFVRDNRLYGAAAGVVHSGELAWSGGVGVADAASGRPAGPDTLYRIASITKTFTGTAIMQLRDAGKLDLDDPAVQWLPELAGSGTPNTIARVTIRRLLSHESGLAGEPPGTDWAKVPPAYEGGAAVNLARAAEIMTTIGPNLQPKYSNLGYQLLGEIVHRVSGTPYTQYVQREILTPLGMTSTTFEPIPERLAGRIATGYSGRTFSDELEAAPHVAGVGAEGGLSSTVEDLARWISFQLGAHEDPPRESPVLAAASRREMHKPRYLSDETWTQAWGITWYAVRREDVTWVQHSGGLHGFALNACFDRDSKVGAIALVNGIADTAALSMDLAAAGRRLALARAPEIRSPQPMPPEFAGLLGLYASAAMTETLRVEWRDGKLAALYPDDPGQAMPLQRSGEPDTFTGGPGFRDSGETVRFHRRDGRVTSVFFGSATLLRLRPADDEAAGR